MSKDGNEIWFPHVKRSPTARVRLFCFPYAGGSALIFRNWINFFDSQVEKNTPSKFAILLSKI